jgi:adenylate cyclase
MRPSLYASPAAFFLSIAGIILAAALYLAGFSFLDLMELKTHDLRLKARTPPPPSPAVALAVIDEKSLERIGRWPWPRNRIARLVQKLEEAGAAVIGLSISFVEPENAAGSALVEALESEMVAAGLSPARAAAVVHSSRNRASGDRALSAAIASVTAPVVLGHFYHMEANASATKHTGVEAGKVPPEEGRASRVSMIRYTGREPSPVPAPVALSREGNLPPLSAATPWAGHINMDADADGIVRWLPLVIRWGEDLHPALALECARLFLDTGSTVVEAAPYGISAIRTGKHDIPTDHAGRLLLSYLGRKETFPYYAVSDILEGNLPPAALKGKIVLVGATAMGTYNAVNTPYDTGGAYPGLEVHATVISNILERQYLVHPGWTRFFDLAMVTLLALLAGWIASRLGALPGFLAAGGLAAAHILLATLLFREGGIRVSVVYPLVALVTSGALVTVHRLATEEREKRKVRSAFSRYAPPAVVSEMIRDPGKLQLGGQERRLTVLFSDIAGFTTFSERLPPGKMVSLLSEYFDAMTEKVFDSRGMLKEYVGDELMAIFGAPLPDDHHAQAACAAALAMQQRLAQMRRSWRAEGLPPLTARTGVNTGSMLVGNLGSSYRFSYGVLGDAVNLGSRLESLNKLYGTRILIGEATAKEVRSDFLLREVDLVTVKGKTRPTAVFELLAEGSDAGSTANVRALNAYAAALNHYRCRRWQQAMTSFRGVLELWPQDGPSQVMLDRCCKLRDQPPAENWRGEFLPEHK